MPLGAFSAPRLRRLLGAVTIKVLSARVLGQLCGAINQRLLFPQCVFRVQLTCSAPQHDASSHHACRQEQLMAQHARTLTPAFSLGSVKKFGALEAYLVVRCVTSAL